MTRNAAKRPPPHDRARAPEQTLRMLPELRKPEVNLKLEKQHRDQDWLAPRHWRSPQRWCPRVRPTRRVGPQADEAHHRGTCDDREHNPERAKGKKCAVSQKREN